MDCKLNADEYAVGPGIRVPHDGGDAQGRGFVPEQLDVNDRIFLKHVVGHEAHSNFRGVVQGGAVMLRGALPADRDLERPRSVIALPLPTRRRTIVAGALLCKAAKPRDLALEEFETWMGRDLSHSFPTHEIRYDRDRTKRPAFIRTSLVIRAPENGGPR